MTDLPHHKILADDSYGQPSVVMRRPKDIESQPRGGDITLWEDTHRLTPEEVSEVVTELIDQARGLRDEPLYFPGDPVTYNRHGLPRPGVVKRVLRDDMYDIAWLRHNGEVRIISNLSADMIEMGWPDYDDVNQPGTHTYCPGDKVTYDPDIPSRGPSPAVITEIREDGHYNIVRMKPGAKMVDVYRVPSQSMTAGWDGLSDETVQR